MEAQKLNRDNWRVEKIAVVGAGIVGIPMGALLAQARICVGQNSPARVCIIQRNSPTSGWKVEAINSGRSPIGGIEPELEQILSRAVAERLLFASHDYAELKEADVILVCVQTDKDGFRPDYEPLLSAIDATAKQLQRRKKTTPPIIIFESTLAPTSLATVIKPRFESYGLYEGRNIFLANSPNRVMPGRLIERIRSSDKIIGSLTPSCLELVQAIYSKIVNQAELLLTNSLTAEVVKTLENAYRDVRIAYSAEIARYCDAHNLDFFYVRDKVNEKLSWEDSASQNSSAVPTGGLLVPTVGVGGHCLPKDGILLLWRWIESKKNLSGSVILEARKINDESPELVARALNRHFGNLSGKSIVLLGTAYRSDSEDTRNSPTLQLALALLGKGAKVILHDPFVKPNDQNLIKSHLQKYFTQDIMAALSGAEYLVFCQAHRSYKEDIKAIIKETPHLKGIFDGCNIFSRTDFAGQSFAYHGIGKGEKKPRQDFLDLVLAGFRAVERGFANEVLNILEFFNDNFCADDFNRVNFNEVRRLAATCVTGCYLAEPGPVEAIPSYMDFSPRLINISRIGQPKIT